MRAHRSRSTGLAALCLLGGVLVFGSLPAFAGLAYVEGVHFGSAGSGGGQFSNPSGVAVDAGSGDVYVVDSGNARVERFDATGSFLSQFGGGETPAKAFSEPYSATVDNSGDAAKGDVYVTDRGHRVIDVFDSTGKYVRQLTGTPGGPFSDLYGVAVDTAGNLWAYESNGNVDEFDDTGSFLTQFNTGRGTEPGFAVDSNDNAYVVFGSTAVGKYDAATHKEVADWSSSVSALAVNLSTNNLFVDTHSKIEEYGPFGEPFNMPIAQIGESALSESFGVAVNNTSGNLYASERANSRVNIYDAVIVPDVSTAGASNVQKTIATIDGTVNPDGVAATCVVEYGTSSSYGENVPCTPANVGSGSD